ncbi:hypothetical protein LOY09_09620 [Staphylococcus aureus]|uniref:hypothetical protein n=1 Tax=Staphylococcus aureus TaxID=1280 RepID=UPI001E479954|nr:hypothetical protein [Staphylococcus aureus]MCC9107101.1 hypothetical protein [Staphylococcus aureus]
MSQTEYQIKPDNITSNSEETSTISKISYEIENANNSGLKKRKIDTQIEVFKGRIVILSATPIKIHKKCP